MDANSSKRTYFMNTQYFYSITLFLVVLLFSNSIMAQDSEIFMKAQSNKDLSDYEVSYQGESSNVSIMNFSGNYDRNINGVLNVEARQAVALELYSAQPDQYDFLVIFTRFLVDSAGADAFAITYENDVQGIGLPIFDNSSIMGGERLQATIDMTELGDWELNPGNRQFDNTLDTLMHEMMHRWGVYVSFEDGSGQISDLTLGRDDSHWNYFLNTNASVMYGSLWNDLGSGQFTTQATRKSLSPLDLYLMGFNEPAAVPGFFLIQEGTPGDRNDLPPLIGTAVTGNRVDISIDNIIAAEGPRIPSADEAQHEFNFKFILLKRPSQTLDTNDIGSLVVLQREFQKRFFTETAGLGEVVYPVTGDLPQANDPEVLTYDLVTNQQVDLAAAEQFIINSYIDEESHWRDKTATQFRDTATAILALRSLEQPLLINNASSWLRATQNTAVTNDHLAWLLISESLSLLDKSAVVLTLLENRNADGGWGLSSGTDSSVYDTALVIKGLMTALGNAFEPTENTIAYINQQINLDGGLGYAQGGKSALTSSALVLTIINELTGNSGSEQPVIDYIIGLQNPDGGFGVGASTAHETALIINALNAANNQDHASVTEAAKTQLTTMQSQDGSFEGSVYSTALAVQVLIDDQKPNLIVSSAQLSNNQAVAGEQVSVEFTVSNSGASNADNVSLAILNGQQVIATQQFASIASEQSLSGRLAFDTSAMQGVVDLQLFIDHENNILEANESDNQALLTLNVQAQTATPELAIDYSSISVNTDFYDALPFDFQASFNVHNLSTTDLTDVKVNLMRVVDEFNREVLETLVLNIDANQSQLYSFNTEITAADGDLELVFVIDPDNQIAEVNEANNELKITLNQQSTVDLVVTEQQINLPNQIVLGQPTEISFEFSNSGTQLSPGFTVAVIYQGSSGSQLLYDNVVSEMPGGQLLTRQFSWTPTELGNYSLEFMIDQNNVVSEVNENNNSIITPISVVGNTSTNLLITDADISINPEPGLTGQTLEITAVIKNNSNSDSGVFDVSFYHQQFDQPSELITTLTDNASINAGAERTVNLVVNDYDKAGDVSFVVEIDAADNLAEFNEDDNIGLNTFRVLNKPDGMVSAGGFSLSPTVPVIDTPLSVAVTVSNLGEQELLNVGVKLYTKTAFTTTEVAQTNLPSIPAGQNQIASFDFTFPNDPDVTALWVEIDETDDIDEINENNNQAELIIENQSRDFYVTESYFSPNGDGIKDQTQIIFNLTDMDNYEIKIVNQFNDVVRRFPVFTNSTFGDVFWNGRDDEQKIAGDGEYLVLLNGANTGEQKLTTVWLDTNRTTMNESLVNDDGYITELNCAIDQIGSVNAERAAKFSLDGQFIYLKSYFEISGGNPKGLFALAVDGSSIKSIIPSSFTLENVVNSFEVLDNGHILLNTSVAISGIRELWYLNTNNQLFYQLDTQLINGFFTEFIQPDYTILRTGNDRLKVYYDTNRPSELITNIFPSGSTLIKINGGWIERNFNAQSIWFRDADLLNPDVLLGQELLGESGDYTRALVKNGDDLILYAFNGSGVSEVKTIEESEEVAPVAHTSRVFFAPDNQFLLINDGFIKLYGINGELKFSVDHPYTFDFIQAALIDNYGSLDALEVDNEIGTFVVSFDQLLNPQIDFQNIVFNWLNETEFSLQFRVSFSADVDPNDAGGIGGYFQFSRNWSFSQRVQFKDYPDWSAFDTGLVGNTIAELNSPYFMSGTSMVRKGLNFDEVDAVSDLFGDFNLLKNNPTNDYPRYVKSLLLRNRNPNYVTTCKDVGDDGIYGVYLPKANLTAFLDLTVTTLGVEIAGTLFDAHLDKYEVFYADSMNPNTWNLIGVGAGEKDRQLLFNWQPPVSGAYRIKLVVTDQAGNNTSVVKSVQVNRSASTITVPMVEPIYFSPNGDGVKDTTTIQYDSLQAGEVLIEITDVNGQVVRSWVKDYAQSGLTEAIIWDGKDNSNMFLDDGEYFIDVDGFKYVVLIDTQADMTIGEFTFYNVPSRSSYDVATRMGHSIFSYRGNLWQLEFKGAGGGGLLGRGEITASPMENSVLQKYIDSNWVDQDSFSFIMNTNNYFEQRELYRNQVTDVAGNVGISEEVSYQEKLFSVELLKLEEPLSENLPFVFPLWQREWVGLLPPVGTIMTEEIAALLTNWNVSDHFAFSFQTLSNEVIESITMTISYKDVNGDTITEQKPLNLADYDVIDQYYADFQEASDDYPEGSFILQEGNDEIVLYLLEFEQSDFPDVSARLNIDFEVKFIGNPEVEHIGFEIDYGKSIEPIFTQIPLAVGVFDSMSEDEKNAYLNMLENINLDSEKTYLWFYLNNQQITSESWVDLSFSDSDQFVSTTSPLFNAASSDHISQLFELELECATRYEAQWHSPELTFNPPLIRTLSKGCDFSASQSFYLNSYCDNSASPNETLDLTILGNLEADAETDPVVLDLYWLNESRVFELIYTDSQLDEHFFIENGVRKYSQRLMLPASNLSSGVNTFKANFSYVDQDDSTLDFSLVFIPDVAEIQVVSPVENQFFCGRNVRSGNNDGAGINLLPIDLKLQVPAAGAKPYALNLLRFVDGVNLDRIEDELLLGESVYGFINDSDFDYSEDNVFDLNDFGFVGSEVQQDILLKFGEREGPVSIQVESINSSGVSHCEMIEIDIDTLVKGFVDENTDDLNFSPAIAGLLNYATLSAEETIQVTIELYQADTLIQEIADFQMVSGEQQALTWDGTIGGNLLADGIYDFVIRMTDTCGNLKLRIVKVILDSTVPGLSFIDPVDGSTVSSFVEIQFMTEEFNLLLLNLEYEYLGLWTPIEFEQFAAPSAGQTLYIAPWDLSELPIGTYPLRLSGTDRAGNESSVTILVNYVESQNLVWDFTLSERFISPNADTVLDQTQIEMGLNLNATIELSVVDNNDVMVKELLNQPLNPGVHTFNWDGSNDLGQIVVDGTYQIKLQATEVGSSTNTVEMYLSLKSDVTLPVSIYNPAAAVIKGEGDFSVTIADTNLRERTATLQQIEPVGEVQDIQTDEEFGHVFSVDLSALLESTYQITTYGNDFAGNVMSQTHDFIIDNTPPVLELESPLDMSFQGGNDSDISFKGRISDNNFAEYKLFISENISDPVWTELFQGNELTDNQFEQIWPISVDDGSYLVRVWVIDQAGWETELIHEITIDRQAPVLDLASPLNNAINGESINFVGTILDANLSFYHLSYQPVGANEWTLVHTGIDAIDSAEIFTWVHDLATGLYRVRLFAGDAADLTSELIIDIEIDSSPPEPAINLQAELMLQSNVRLAWQPSPSEDLAGYQIFRNNTLLNAELITTNNYDDLNLPEGVFSYWVIAVDVIGNQSEPSNVVDLLIDRTGPSVSIQQPVNSSVVNGLLDVIATVEDVGDFEIQRLYIRLSGQAPPGELVAESFLPSQTAVLAQIDTLGLNQDSDYIIRLEAQDTSANVNVIEHTVTVDNVAPSAPLNLTHQLIGSADVRLDWQVNLESDLAGYLVYRDDRIISGNGTPESGIITGSTYLDSDVTDGEHRYYITATDLAGNISDISNEITVNINRRAPDTVITNPGDASEFENPISITATSNDDDIAFVTFEYSLDNVSWLPLSQVNNSPFSTVLDPQSLNLVYGPIYVRAFAEDTGGQVDLTPAQISLEYKDLTPPGAVQLLAALVIGDEIQLSWDANLEPDLQGYQVARKQLSPILEDEFTDMTPAVILTENWVDTAVNEGVYLYRVYAVDDSDNLSNSVETEELTVWSVELEQPFSPVLLPADISINGFSVVQGDVNAVIEDINGVQTLPTEQVGDNGLFNFTHSGLNEGLSQFTLHVEDVIGNQSIKAMRSIEASPLPLSPVNPQQSVNGLDVDMSWQAPDAGTIGYLPYIYDVPVLERERLVTGISINVSSSSFARGRVLDNNPNSYWVPTSTDLRNGQPTFIELHFNQPVWITSTEINWRDSAFAIYSPSTYLLQYESPVGWITQKDFTGDESITVTHTGQVPYLATAARIWMPLEANNFDRAWLSEFKVNYQPLITDLNYSTSLPDGNYNWQVSAINQYGFESERTVVEAFAVGDVTPPDAVVLSGDIENANNVQLNWNASGSGDVASYRVFRNDELLFNTADASVLSYLDSGLANGNYEYYVVAVDAVGNASTGSNKLNFDISQQVLDPPTGLIITVEEAGSALLLSWDTHPSPDWSAFKIYRSVTENIGFEEVQTTSSQIWLDDEVVNGVRYYYYLTAVDQLGNESQPSFVVSGVPNDLLAPIKPLITDPTTAGNPITVNALTTEISGFGTPGAAMDLYQNNDLIDSVFASTQFTEAEINLNKQLEGIVFNSRNTLIAFDDFNIGEIVILDPITEIYTPLLGAYPREYFWNNAGDKLYGIDGSFDQTAFKSFGLDGNEISTFLSGFELDQAKIADDESQILYGGRGINPSTGVTERGLWLYETASQTHQKVELGSSIRIYPNAIEWLPNGNIAFINSPNGTSNVGELWILNPQTEQLQLIEAEIARRSTLRINHDKTHLFYEINVNGNQAIKRYRISDGEGLIYAEDGVDIRMPEVRQNPDILLINYDDFEKRIIDLDSGEVIQTFENVGYRTPVTWLDDGRIMFINFDRIEFFIPPGTFTFSGVNLTPGLNEFYVVANKENGTSSEPSDSIEVTLNEAVLADLEIKPSYLQLIPSQVFSGQSLSGSALVKNNSLVDVEQARMIIELIDPDLNSQLIEPTPLDFSLAAGELLVENFIVDDLEILGEYTVRVLVDSNQQVLETNENNNSVVKVIQVIDDLNADLEVVLFDNELFPGTDLTGSLRVYNPGESFDGSVSLRITDSDGYPVGYEQTYVINELLTASAWEQGFVWSTADVFAGPYVVEVILHDENQQILEQQQVNFNVSEAAELSVSLTSNLTQIPVGEAVNLVADISYLAGNSVQSGELIWQVFDDSQQLVWSNTQATGAMSPGFNGVFENTWSTTQAGSYQVRITLDTPLVLEVANIPIEVTSVAAELSLTGVISSLSEGVILGQAWNSPYTIENIGDIDVTNVPLSLSLWNSDLSQIIGQQNASVSLNAGMNTQLTADWDSNNLLLENYVLVLTADLSGFGETGTYLIDTVSVQAVDATAPQISFNNPVELGFYPNHVELRIGVVDLHAEVDSVDIYLDGELLEILPGQASNSVYVYDLSGLAEGPHVLNVVAQDTFDNSGSETLTFNVDNTPPVIDVSGVEDAGLYNQTVQANVLISDLNLSDSQIILDGMPYVSADDISSEGSHILIASAEDLAGNSNSVRISFNIDLTAPTVLISYPANNSEISEDTTVVSGSTEAFATVTLTSGAYTATVTADFAGNFSFADVPLESGENTIAVSSVDRAGNAGGVSTVVVNFIDAIIVNGFLTTPSTQGIGSDLTVAWQLSNLNSSEVTDLPVEVNLYRTTDNQLLLSDMRTLTISAAGTVMLDSVFDTTALNVGDHRIELRIQIDGVWQTLDVDLVLLEDVIGPAITVIEPVMNQITQATVDFLVQASDVHSEVDTVSYQLDNSGVWLPLSWDGMMYSLQLEIAHGDHEVVFRAIDSFNNETLSDVLQFTVDTESPVIDVVTPTDGLITNQAVTIDFNVTDDHSFTVEAMLEQSSITNGHVVNAEGEYELIVSATDEVNNMAQVSRSFIIDTTRPTLVVTTPIDGSQNITGFQDIIGSAEARNIITILVNGVETVAKTDAVGDFVSLAHVLQLGNNEIVVTATDQAGNVSDPVTLNVEYTQVSAVNGRVWQDDDQNGVIGMDEIGFDAVTVRLTDSDNISQDMLTDGNGFYSFDGLLPASYNLAVIEPELLNDWSNTTANNPVEIMVEADQNSQVDFGFYQDKALLDASLSAHSIRGRVLILGDPQTAQVDIGSCAGVADYQLQRQITHDFAAGDTVWAEIYDSQGNLLQTETASYADFVNQGQHPIDQQAETGEFNLLLLPVVNHQIQAKVVHSSATSVLTEDYRVVLGLQANGETMTWSSDDVSVACATYDQIGGQSGELKFSGVGLFPTLASDDPNSAVQSPHLRSQYVMLENIMQDAGWSYQITTDEVEFESQLASGEFVAYWLMAENVLLSTQAQNDLMTAVNEGAGLLVSSGHDNLSSQFYSSLGVSISGNHDSITELDLADSPFTNSAVLDVLSEEQGLKVSLSGAQSAATFNGVNVVSPENQAITWLDTLEGSSIFSSLDLLLQATADMSLNGYIQLLKDVLAYSHPLGLSNDLGYARAIQFDLQNLGRPVDGYVQVLLPASVTLAHADTPVTPNTDGFRFEFDLLADQLMSTEFWVTLDASPATVTFEIYLDDDTEVFESLDLVLIAGERPDLNVSINNCQSGARPEQLLSYQLQVNNSGNVQINQAQLDSSFTAGLTGINWVCTATSGSACHQSSGVGGLSAVNIDVAPGGAVNYVFSAQVGSQSVDAITANAAVLMPELVGDVSPEDNQASDADAVYQFLFKNGFECAAPGDESSLLRGVQTQTPKGQ